LLLQRLSYRPSCCVPHQLVAISCRLCFLSGGWCHVCLFGPTFIPIFYCYPPH
jgi:hypothetical protein